MDVIKVKCKNCGSLLEVGLDNLEATCPYCGHKTTIEFDGMSEVLLEKEKTNRAKMSFEHEANEKAKDFRREQISKVTMWVPFLIIFLVIGIIAGVVYLPHSMKVSNLKKIETEIENAVQVGDFDLALFKANQLRCDDDWSSKESASWDKKRKEYIELIEEMKRESQIQMPHKSSYYKGKKYQEVVEQLESIGFTSVLIEPSSESASIWHKEDTVDYVVIDGKTSFSTKDYFDTDVQVIVYYYSK